MTPFILLLAITVGHWLARRALLSVATVSRQGRRIGMASLHERLPVRYPHRDLGALAEVSLDAAPTISARPAAYTTRYAGC